MKKIGYKSLTIKNVLLKVYKKMKNKIGKALTITLSTKLLIVIVLSLPILLLSPISNYHIFPALSKYNEKGTFISVLLLGIYLVIQWAIFKDFINSLTHRIPGLSIIMEVVLTLIIVAQALSLSGFNVPDFSFELAAIADLLFINYYLMRREECHLLDTKKFTGILPQQAQIKIGNELKNTSSHSLQKGDHIVVNEKGIVPCDSILIEKPIKISELWLSGLKQKVNKDPGSIVAAGSLVESSADLQVVNIVKDNYVNSITEILRNAMFTSTSLGRRSTKTGRILLLISLGLSLMGAVAAVLLNRPDKIMLVLNLLLIGCSYATVIAVPLVVLISIKKLFSFGILIKNREAFENARNIEELIFDKTGTLTEEKYGVVDIVSFSQRLTREEIIKFAASVEQKSNHPVARAIMEFSGDILNVTNFEQIESRGVTGNVEGKKVKVVNFRYLIEKGIKYDINRHSELSTGGKVVVFLVIDNETYGAVILSDVIRAQARAAVKKLKKMRIKTSVLTPDTKNSAQWIAQELQLDEYIGETPKDLFGKRILEKRMNNKVIAVAGKEERNNNMFDAADVAFAIGTGIKVDIPSADVLFYNRNPYDTIRVIKMSKLVYRVIVQNLVWITFYSVLALLLIIFAFLKWNYIPNPVLAALLSVLATIVVIINSRYLTSFE